LDRAAQTLCYVLSNRIIFYEAIRVRQPGLPKLAIPPRIADGEAAYKHFQRRFQQAVEATGDYEPLFHPQEQKDWAGPLIFRSPGALDAWRAVLRSVEGYNLRTVPHDVVGKIFQRLISPEERHKFGQHFTHEDVVDVINAFCIRRPDAVVLDPSCGSGSFLVRAYHRKAWLSEQPSAAPGEGRYHKSHQELLQEIFGCDIALFPAHLATLNLAARQIEKEENYPLIARRNFFDVDRGQPFCQVPGARVGKHREMRDVPVPEFHAIVGNPPYVRQELIPRRDQRAPVSQTKEYLQQLVSDAWPGLELSGRSDLHCYFWPAACRFLRDNGHFGFLTSSSWLDVEYGFPLQAWILCHFKLIAIIESTDEPWFEAARVKTCATILQRCRDEAKRMDNKVRFVRLKKPLAEILGERPNGDESARQRAADELRKLIEGTSKDYSDENLRIIVKSQRDLWDEGVAAARVIEGRKHAQPEMVSDGHRQRMSDYGGGKWGRYLRAPDFFFEIMREFGRQFVKLGEIAEVRSGVRSGCDGFFMPHDVTQWALSECPDPLSFKSRFGCRRDEVAACKLKIVKAGDGSVHPIESEYLAPEVHSLMVIDRPV
ncbi:MAG: SAM-dependent methyltransferase, partial [Planctomycetes bacterium]|nr:SAM-dependent methyltransferase [Planctomycetota bacterium]